MPGIDELKARYDDEQGVLYSTCPEIDEAALNALFAASWPDHSWRGFTLLLSRSLAYVCASASGELIGFVNVAWDGGIHACLLDTTVHPRWRRQGIGRALVREAVAAAAERGIAWVHVDFEPHLREFYSGCGFQPTEAGLLHCAAALESSVPQEGSPRER
jgi:GNAT superfamily N-acetyltransferase